MKKKIQIHADRSCQQVRMKLEGGTTTGDEVQLGSADGGGEDIGDGKRDPG